MDTPPDFPCLRRQAARASARRLRGGGVVVAPGHRGRIPGSETRVKEDSRGVDDPTILWIERAAAATPLVQGRTA